MPCDSSHMESSQREKEMTKVVQLLDELDGIPVDPETFGNGYDKRVYNQSVYKERDDDLVSELCERLQSLEDVNSQSLELQMWWRDHQEADRKRLEFEMRRRKTEEERKAAVSKLTPYERKLLGVEP